MRRKWVPVLGVFLIGFLALLFRHSLDRFDLTLLDGEITSSSHPQPPWPDDLLQVVIDDAAISRYSAAGQWPVTRREVARVIDRLRELGAKTIFYDGTLISRTDPVTDAAVARSLAGVILPITYSKVDAREASSLEKAEMPLAASGIPRYAASDLRSPIEPFASAAGGLGSVVALFDRDGVQRVFLPVIGVGTAGLAIPSAPLLALSRQRGLDLQRARVTEDELEVPGLPSLPLDRGVLRLELPRDVDARKPRLTMTDLLEKDAESLRARVAGKLVIVYTENKTDSSPSLLSPETYGGQVLSHAVRQMVAGHGSRRAPQNLTIAGLAVLAMLAAIPLASRAPRSIAGGTLGAMILYAVAQSQLFHHRDLFLPILVPEVQLAASGVLLAVWATWSAAERADWHRAPTGTVAIVFTDVQGSTTLWEQDRNAMQRALALHNACFRALLADFGGYEVKTEGDAFMIAFPDAMSAAAWCLTVQATLLALDWPKEILQQADAAEVATASGDLLFRGLRVRMGIHLGEPEPHVDPLTARMDYFGPMVNKAARVSGAARGGQILVSGEAWSVLMSKRGLLPPIEVRDLGKRALKGLATETQLVEITPVALAARQELPAA